MSEEIGICKYCREEEEIELTLIDHRQQEEWNFCSWQCFTFWIEE